MAEKNKCTGINSTNGLPCRNDALFYRSGEWYCNAHDPVEISRKKYFNSLKIRTNRYSVDMYRVLCDIASGNKVYIHDIKTLLNRITPNNKSEWNEFVEIKQEER